MQLRIPHGGDVIVSCTDRINSYMAFNCSYIAKQDGLMYGNEVLLKDFYLKTTDGKIFSRFDAMFTEMSYNSFTVFFRNKNTQKLDTPSVKITISLLLTGRKLPVVYFEVESIECSTTDDRVILCLGKHVVEIENTLSNVNGIVEVNTLNSSNDEFKVKKLKQVNDITSVNSKKIHEKTKFFCHFTETINGKIKCTLSDIDSDFLLLSNHQTSIEEYLNKIAFSINSFEESYCEALKWASFSGWSLVTGLTERGIWAGLPWFRDNWGRDTFIALSGILLVTGCFNEAKSVIESFARHQEKNMQSQNYGRIPNRYRNDEDVIFNTADGTLWFIREVWEYAQYTGDIAFLREMFPVVCLALEADRTRRTDNHGFLLHGDADTWMDARIENDIPWSPRGNRANDIQALWYTALVIGSRMAEILINTNTSVENTLADKTPTDYAAQATVWRNLAEKVRTNFNRLYLTEDGYIVDCLHKDGTCDKKIRPNQFLCLSIPSILEDTFVPLEKAKQIIENNCKKLVFPHGVCSLDQNDYEFHPYHDGCKFYHKDAAYHNGTIWLWNTGTVVESLCTLTAQNTAWNLTGSLTEQILLKGNYSRRAAGTLSENLDAYKTNGCIKPSGTWSQAWSVSEFCRNAYQQYLGVIPRLLDGKIDFTPRFPSLWKKGNADVRFAHDVLHIEWCDEKEITKFKVCRQMCKLDKLDKLGYEFGQLDRTCITDDFVSSIATTTDTDTKEQLNLIVYLNFDGGEETRVFPLDVDKVVLFSGYIPGHRKISGKANRFTFSTPFNEKSEWGSLNNPKQQSILEKDFLLKRRKSAKNSE